MLEIALFVLVAWGLTNVLVASYILEPVRAWIAVRSVTLGVFLSCAMCVGFWVGALESLVGLSPVAHFMLTSHSPLHIVGGDLNILSRAILGVVLDGFLASGSVWVLFLASSRLVGGSHE